MINVIPIPALKDNYIWLIVNDQRNEAIAVDPGDASPVLSYLKAHHLTLIAILVTHKHLDHTGGIKELVTVYPEIPVYAYPIKEGDTVSIPSWPMTFEVMHIPGHTLCHVAYYSVPLLFTGDTLFGGGCGRVFEGTAAQMVHSLNKLAALPDDTQIYCGHEYTLANLNFALKVDSLNADIKERIRLTKIPSLPSTMAIEKKTNPFLRCEDKNIITSVEEYVGRQLTKTEDVFHELREWKNNS